MMSSEHGSRRWVAVAVVAAVAVAFAVAWGCTSDWWNADARAAYATNAARVEEDVPAASMSSADRALAIASVPAAVGVDVAEEGETYEADHVVITFEGEKPDADVLASLQRAVTLDVPDASAVDVIADGIAVVPVHEGASVAQAIEELSGETSIKSAEVDAYAELFDNEEGLTSALAAVEGASADSEASDDASLLSLSINDPSASSQWALSDANANMYAVWDRYVGSSDESGAPAVVAVLDTGVDSDHPDLVANIVYPYNAVEGEKTTDYEDVDEHGTHCAGIVAAAANNGVGVAGISYNTQVMPVRVFHKNASGSVSGSTTDIIRGIQYAIDQKNEGVNVRVISMSLGYTGTSKEDLEWFSSLTDAIDQATEAGILCVVAAGNESSTDTLTSVSVPACYDKCVAVGSIESDHVRSGFSNGDDTLDVVAPGGSIYSTVPDDTYKNMSGTSMAAPYVAAVAALCFKYHPNATPAQVMEALEATAFDLGDVGWDAEYGYGQVLPSQAVEYLSADASYITFSSDASFTLEVSDGTGGWNGTMSSSAANASSWTTWDGSRLTAAQAREGGEYTLRIKGDASNTTITSGDASNKWVITATAGYTVSCSGNIESLRGATGNDASATTMASGCYAHLFADCTALASAPALPATTLAQECYKGMFNGCTALTAAPKLPATSLATGCYEAMFSGCAALASTPYLAATSLVQDCYADMFSGCTSLASASKLPATELVQGCYTNMFSGCTSLMVPPEMSATTLAQNCCRAMFSDCTSLRSTPDLPATTLAQGCYAYMFSGCTSLVNSPELPAATLVEQCYSSMFSGCTSLSAPADMSHVTQIETAGAGEVGCCQEMYKGCTGICVYANASECPHSSASWKVNSVSSGAPSNWAQDMFAGTGGTFTGAPACEGVYYLDAIAYLEYNAETGEFCEVTSSAFTEVDADMSIWGAQGEETWYVVCSGTAESPLTVSHSVKCAGKVHLILTNGCALKVQAATGTQTAGICVSGVKNSLHVHGQADGAGSLEAIGSSYGAGIGGGDYGNASAVVIDGGTVTATGGFAAAGIGGGCYGSVSGIVVNGGTVTATGGKYGAGIGAGYNGDASGIVVNGGTVTATGGQYAAGIGGSYYGDASNITFNGGTVNAAGASLAVGVGGGYYGSASGITASTCLAVRAGAALTSWEDWKTLSGVANTGEDLADSLAKHYVRIAPRGTSWGAMLGGQIEVRITLDLADYKDQVVTAHIVFDDATATSTASKELEIEDDGTCVLTFDVAAKNMADTYSVTLTYDSSGTATPIPLSSEEGGAFTGSLKAYLDDLAAQYASDETEQGTATYNMAMSTLAYGSAAQACLGTGTAFDVDESWFETAVPATADEALRVYKATVTSSGTVEDASFGKRSLVLEGNTSLRQYLSLDSTEGLIFTVNDQTSAVCTGSNGTYLEAAGITPTALDAAVTFKVSFDDENWLQCSVAPLCYAKAAAHNALSDATMQAAYKKLGEALYYYNMYAEAYNAAQSAS